MGEYYWLINYETEKSLRKKDFIKFSNKYLKNNFMHIRLKDNNELLAINK
jgi:hypothetical protein